jgi:peptide/nickel transport system substrate-binding protein
VRQAINLALDRNQMSTVGEDGYEPPANPTGLILPGAQQFLAPQYANATFTTDPTQAQSILTSAGYTKGSDGVFAKGGKRLSFTIEVTAGYTDWISAMNRWMC